MQNIAESAITFSSKLQLELGLNILHCSPVKAKNVRLAEEYVYSAYLNAQLTHCCRLPATCQSLGSRSLRLGLGPPPPGYC